jgi:nitrogen fixation protein NifU and related proteins
MDRKAIIDTLLEHYEQPHNYGPLEDADVVLPGGIPDCGDKVTIYLKVAPGGERIAGLRFEGQGCTISMAAASMLTEQMQGASLAEAASFDENALIDLLGREVVQSRPRCATLALGTLKAAVRQYKLEVHHRGAEPAEI